MHRCLQLSLNGSRRVNLGGRAAVLWPFGRGPPSVSYCAAMQVLVCGADGFLGRHIVSGLRAAGHDVVAAVFTREPTPQEVYLDVTRPEQVAALALDVDAVVNAAGIVDPKGASSTMFSVNAEGARNLARWARHRRVRHFVQVSSVAVYGPLVLGESRVERTPRMGLAAGSAYMRSKALAELWVERSGVPYTMLRPPVVMGAGDSVLSGGFFDALQGGGLPLLPGACGGRRVTLAFAEGLAEVTGRVLERGPLNGAVHVVDADVSLRELGEIYAAQLRSPCRFREVRWQTVLNNRNDLGFSWLAASARFGQHYSSRRLVQWLGYRSGRSLELAVQASLSGLQGQGEVLS